MPDASPAPTNKLQIFISYSRDDLEFTDQLDIALKFCGFATTMDRHGLVGGEDWERRLRNLIREADTVVFVLSPASAISDACALEVEQADRLGKRIMPVICRPLNGTSPPARLKALNYIFFYKDPASPGSGFGSGIERLVTALNTDTEWLRAHTRYSQRASEWDEGGRPDNRLLSGTDIVDAKHWVKRRPRSAPEPTALHLDYFRASEASELRRDDAERRRLEEIEAAQAERAKALVEAETALEREARALKQRSRLRNIALIVVGGFAAVAGWQWYEAEAQRKVAIEQTTRADDELAKALRTQSLFLADLSKQELEKGNVVNASLLAIEAMPDETSANEVQRSRPLVNEAQSKLTEIWSNIRELVVQSGHTGEIWSIQYSRDGSRVLSFAPIDGTVRLWNASDLAELGELRDSESQIATARFSSDSAHIIGARKDNTIRIWDAKSLTPRLTLQGHTNRVYAAKYDTSGERLLSVSADKTAIIWDAGSGRRLLTLAHPASVLAIEASSAVGRLVTYADDDMVRIWDAASGALLLAIDASAKPDPGERDARPSDAVVAAVRIPTRRSADLAFGYERRLSVTPDGRRALVVGSDGSAQMVELATGKVAAVLRDAQGKRYSVGGMAVTGQIAFSPDGKSVAMAVWGHDTLHLWDAETGKQKPELLFQASNILNVAFSPDSRLVAVAGDKGIQLGETATGLLVARYAHNSTPLRIAFSPDGRRLASGSGDGTVRLWGLTHERAIGQIGNAVAPWRTDVDVGEFLDQARANGIALSSELLAFLKDGSNLTYGIVPSPTGSLMATIPYGDSDDVEKPYPATIWRTGDGVRLGTLGTSAGKVIGGRFSPDEQHFYALGAKGDITVWQIEPFAYRRTLAGHTGGVYELKFSDKGDRLFTVSPDRTMRVWDTRSGRQIALSPWSSRSPDDASFVGDRPWVLIASGSSPELWDYAKSETRIMLSRLNPSVLRENELYGFRIKFGDERGTELIIEGGDRIHPAVLRHSRPLRSIAFSGDRRQIATSDGQALHLWKLSDERKLLEWAFDKDIGILSALSNDGGQVISLASKTVWQSSIANVWDLRTKTLIARFELPDSDIQSARYIDGQIMLTTKRRAGLASKNSEKVFEISMWPAPTRVQDLVNLAKVSVPRCLTSEERETKYFLQPPLPSWCSTMGKWPHRR